ncbi:MAG TPA: ROK family protein, partial [Candidatus Merdibacter merdigallinarum]|nr:ROK family protein [Candidatus Merdibacter merdigallinarum]
MSEEKNLESAVQASGSPSEEAPSVAPVVTTVDSKDAAKVAVQADSAAPLHIGIDVGSTTVKVAVLDDENRILHSCYKRHHADIRATIVEVVGEAAEKYPATPMTIAITGSGGLLLAQWLGIEFVQEVIASKTAVETFIPQTDVVIELGGEDAKIIYFDNGIEQRMNGTCA